MRGDGTPDTFGGDANGRITLPACGPARNVVLVAAGDDGAFAWAGNCLAHLNGDGSIDAAFGNVSLRTTTVQPVLLTTW